MVGSRSRTIAPGYGDLALGCAEFGEVKSLRILVVTLDSKLDVWDSSADSSVKGS